MNHDLTKISKQMSYTLRHHPEKIGINMDEYGRVDLTEFISKFNRHYQRPISLELINQIIESSDKQRYAIEGHTIRALYGHSIPVKLLEPPTTPPAILYHGTTHSAAKVIKDQGIKKMDRDFVHLSSTIEMAQQVGARRDSKPVIIRVKAGQAASDGTPFYKTQSGVWLTDYVAPKYLEF
ncbi:RNA 2'-phosphotransferase [Lentilactobacillus sp. Marseille-Q4993]|uniref:RNA 2'-phosphotransferase n=1 Tax=Lentilactobacillus sp. Marseille-Q4993 TaxID=3039492 RepID=UPI0024BC1BD2|nr:RNA 2'-phosphotransferase [Lentilactobacillus sp. Marseille-Q4993]